MGEIVGGGRGGSQGWASCSVFALFVWIFSERLSLYARLLRSRSCFLRSTRLRNKRDFDGYARRKTSEP